MGEGKSSLRFHKVKRSLAKKLPSNLNLLDLWQAEFFGTQGVYFYLPRAAILALEGESPIIVLP